MTSVHIVVSDRGWILETLAKNIADRLPYVSYDVIPRQTAKIQYYMTYGCRQERVSPFEMALFTHREEIPSAARQFNEAATAVDLAIAMSRKTGQILTELGINNTRVISPGVDLNLFRPKLKIGVVGRTYHTGRKGEALIDAVIDMPDIEWHFTGDGWPEAAIHVPENELPAFYRSMDYVLVPATNEGGPMCVLEALASGVEVIGPDVGRVADFPHIAFEKGDPESLRKVLNGLLEKRRARATAVAGNTWDQWAEKHAEIFESTLDGLVAPKVHGRTSHRTFRESAALILHGSEGTTLGGPSIRIPRTADNLRAQGVRAEVVKFPSKEIINHDVIHGFNIWPLGTSSNLVRQAVRLSKPLVFSPIFLDLSNVELWSVRLPASFHDPKDLEKADERIADLHSLSNLNGKLNIVSDPVPGYRGVVREISELSDAIIFLSEKEKANFIRWGGRGDTGTIVRNPVSSQSIQDADGRLFQEQFGLSEYVLCVGRIEPRKNQLLLAHALRGTGLTLVLVGHGMDSRYTELIKALPDVKVIFTGRLQPNSPLLRSAFAGARVFALPSFAEGAPLAALEAAAMGARMVLSNRSGEIEYFGERASYCDPFDPASIRTAVLDAWNAEWSEQRRAELRDHVGAQFSWERYTAETAMVYDQVLENRQSRGVPEAVTRLRRSAEELCANSCDEIVMDVTSSLNYGTHLSGIARVERELSLALGATPHIRVRFVVWNSASQFEEVPGELVLGGTLRSYMERARFGTKRPSHFKRNGHFLVVGSGWMQNPSYASGISQFSRLHELKLNVLIHDLTPVLFPYWYTKGYSQRFQDNLVTVILGANHLITYSESTKRDLIAFSLDHDVPLPSTFDIKLGADIRSIGDQDQQWEMNSEICAKYSTVSFALATGAIHPRKNYGLLHDVWVQLRQKLKSKCPHLLIVGGVNSNGEDAARAMLEDPRTAGFIHILSNVGDGDLDWLYRNCIFTLYPSLYEGWGLPVAESLSFGKICIASNASSIPEIASNCTDLLDPSNRTAWSARVLHYATSSSARTAREQFIQTHFRPSTWRDAGVSLLKGLSEPRRVSEPTLYSIGLVLSFASSVKRAVGFLAGGWHVPEKWGTWSWSPRPKLQLCLSTLPHENLVLNVAMKLFEVGKVTRHCTVRANGSIVAVWSFPKQAEYLRTAIIPKTLVGDGTLNIEFEIDRVAIVSEVNPKSSDGRALGIGLSMIQLESIDRSRARSLTDRSAELGELPIGRWLSAKDPALVNAVAGITRAADGKIVCTRSGKLEFTLPHPGRASGMSGLPSGSLRLRCILRAVGDGNATVCCVVNGNEGTSWVLPASEPVLCEIIIASCDVDPINVLLFTAGGDNSMPDEENSQAFTFSLLALEVTPLINGEQDRKPTSLETVSLVQANASGTVPHSLSPSWLHALDSGWYPIEPDGVWSIGTLGIAKFSRPMEREMPYLALFVRIARPLLDQGQHVTLLLDDAPLGHLDFPAGQPGQITTATAVFPILQGSGSPSNFVLSFLPERGLNPSAEWRSRDSRILGVALQELVMVELPPIPLDAMYSIGSGTAQSSMIADGWHSLERHEDKRWLWSNGAAATIYLRLPEANLAELKLLATIGVGFATPLSPKTVTVSIAGRSVFRVAFETSAPSRVVIPLEGVEPDCKIIAVRFVQDEPIKPSVLGTNDDTRLLGVQLLEIGLTTSDDIGALDDVVVDLDAAVVEEQA